METHPIRICTKCMNNNLIDGAKFKLSKKKTHILTMFKYEDICDNCYNLIRPEYEEKIIKLAQDKGHKVTRYLRAVMALAKDKHKSYKGL